MIRIKSKKKNFRRCGIAHDDQWVKYPDGRFSPDEIAILKAEPMLTVEAVQEIAGKGGERPENGDPGIQTGPSDLPPAPGKGNKEQPVKSSRKGKR